MNLEGIFPPLTTPFDSSGGIDRDALQENLKKYNACDLAGYLILGSTGESVYLTAAEKLQVLETARQHTPSGRVLLAGAMVESTQGCIDFLKQLAALGVDAALVGVPHYFKSQMTDEVVAEHYLRVADAASLPILLYNVPQFSGLRISADVVAQLSGHPRVIGIKDSSGDLQYDQEILQMVGDGDFHVLTGSASVLLPGLMLGLHGAIVAIACALPALPIHIFRSFAADWRGARRVQHRMFPLSRAVTDRFGIAGLKYLMDRVGFQGGLPRAPLRPLREEQVGVLEELLIQSEVADQSEISTRHP